MTEREREAFDKMKEKVSKYEEVLEKALEGPYKPATVLSGPDQGLYLVSMGGGNAILPANPSITIPVIKSGTRVMVNQQFIIAVLPDTLVEKEPEIEFDYIKWEEIGGIGSQMEKIRESVENPILYEKYYTRFGLKPVKGILLYGPPGCGKTMIAKAIASFMLKDGKIGKDSFVYLKGGELLNPYVGVTEGKIKSIFENARASFKKTGKRSVIFIDEAEAILPTRGSRRSSDVDSTIVPTFLSEMDGFETNGTFVILATNHPSQLDPAVVRAGRIDVHVEISRPTQKDAEEIFEIHLNKTSVKGNVKDVAKEASEILFLSDHVSNVSGAMIATIVQQSIQNAIKRLIKADKEGKRTDEKVTINDIENAIKTI